MHSSDHTEHHTKWPCYLTRTRRDCTSANCVLKWNTRLLVTQKESSAFPSANKCQSQLQTPQLLSVVIRIMFAVTSDGVQSPGGATKHKTWILITCAVTILKPLILHTYSKRHVFVFIEEIMYRFCP